MSARVVEAARRGAGGPADMESQATVCPQCGAKVRSDRGRCPRCRALIAAADPAAVAAANRRFARVALALAGVFVAGLAVLWLTRPAAPKTPALTGPPPDPFAARRQVPAAEPAAPAADAERAFLDPPAVGSQAYDAGDYASSLAQFQAAVERNPQDAESWSNLGQVLVRLNRVKEAIPCYERALALLPDRWAYQFNLARALGLLGDWEQSVAGYRRAQALFPDDYVTTFNLALALHKKGDEAAAVAEYRKAIALQPEDASFRLALATSLERLQKPKDAADAYAEYLRLSPTAADADKVRARIARLSGAGG